MNIAKNIAEINKKIATAAAKAKRHPSDIKLVAVTKTVGISQIEELLNLGISDIAENRLQQALPKIEALSKRNILSKSIKWHFIGHLQKNKGRKVLKYFDIIHSVDSLDLANRINTIAQQENKKVQILLEVNISGETNKYGLDPYKLDYFLDKCKMLSMLEVKGLMTMAPFSDNKEDSRPIFRQLKQLAARYKLPELSMGMSNDFEVAIEEGATFIRIGSALFY